MADEPGERQPSYRELRERAKRQEDRREQNLKRIVDLHRARSLRSTLIADGDRELRQNAG
jgi:hypothetical protein